MVKPIGRWLGTRTGCLCLFLALVLAPAVTAQTPPPDSVLLTRDQIQAMIDKALADRESKDKQKKQADAAQASAAGKPKLEGTWDNGLVFVSPNKDWKLHVGGRFEFNSVWFDQPEAMRSPAPGGGVPAADRLSRGVGPMDDGTYFRRLRLRMDGTGYEKVEFMMEVDFEQINYLNFEHMWVGMKDLPVLGTVRIGQHKVPQGLDMVGSDYYLTFLERSVLSEAFLTLFAPGVYISNTYLDNNVTTHAMFHKTQPLQFYDGAAFGDGNYAFTGRATWTPVYENEGACVVHLGGSYQIRSGNLGRTIAPGTTGDDFLNTQNVVRFRARPELRDAVGIVTPVIGGTSGRFVDTGFLMANYVQTIDPEFMVTWGPLNFRAETALSYVDQARTPGPGNTLVSRGSPFFWGGYAQVSYFLTGEHWGYDRRQGVYDRPRVINNAFLVKGEDGQCHHGIGAWEVAYRYSFVDLNDTGIDGGQMGQHVLGLNWYLNDNTRLQLNYLNIQRNVAGPAVSGTVHAIGLQAQWYF